MGDEEVLLQQKKDARRQRRAQRSEKWEKAGYSRLAGLGPEMGDAIETEHELGKEALDRIHSRKAPFILVGLLILAFVVTAVLLLIRAN